MQTQTPIADVHDIIELYDALMWEIEPELTTELLPDIEFMYENETPEEHKLRAEWYAIAFEQLNDRMTKFSADAKNHLTGIKNHIITLAQKDSAEDDKGHLEDVERSLSL